jgi:vanillate O-demethylase monooxygenase subunit
MFIRNAWYGAGFAHELDGDRLHAVEIIGEPLVLWRDTQGRVVAFEDRCAHRAAPLSMGRVEGDTLRCMYHGVLFDAQGRGVQVPGQPKPSDGMAMRRYAAHEQDGWLWVWMGDPAQADVALVPPAFGRTDERWTLGGAHVDYVAHYELINDNLCDFSHVAYVHVNSFGGGQEGVVEQFAHRPTIEPLARGIRVTRWSEDSPAPPFLAGVDVDGLLDLYMTYDYLVPGVLLMWTGLFPRGTARALQYAKPTLAPLHSAFSSQVVTPIDARHTRYYFTWGPSTAENRPFLKDIMVKLAATAFEEDRLMIEAQQRVLDRTPEVKMQPTVHDRGPNLMRGVVRRLLEAEVTQA